MTKSIGVENKANARCSSTARLVFGDTEGTIYTSFEISHLVMKDQSLAWKRVLACRFVANFPFKIKSQKYAWIQVAML